MTKKNQILYSYTRQKARIYWYYTLMLGYMKRIQFFLTVYNQENKEFFEEFATEW